MVLKSQMRIYQMLNTVMVYGDKLVKNKLTILLTQRKVNWTNNGHCPNKYWLPMKES